MMTDDCKHPILLGIDEEFYACEECGKIMQIVIGLTYDIDRLKDKYEQVIKMHGKLKIKG